ncbi:protein AATF [Nilaparvata lugens]|uniref:protein AATF n=1 Tax=Nilaparvata lugens TaxID=108931 RepID=UPI00193D4BFA|nr:protein AATF [Nilaparvata lugens]
MKMQKPKYSNYKSQKQRVDREESEIQQEGKFYMDKPENSGFNHQWLDFTNPPDEDIEEDVDDSEYWRRVTKGKEVLPAADTENLNWRNRGTKVSRKELTSDDSIDDESDDGDDDFSDAMDSVGSAEENEGDGEFTDDDMSSADEKPAKANGKRDENEPEDSSSIYQYTKKSLDVHEDIEKGNAIRKQYEIWETLLECRIKLQKCLAASNRLPQIDNFSQMVSKLAKPEQNKISKTVKHFGNTLSTLIDLQAALMSCQPEFITSSKRSNEEDAEMNDGGDDDDDASISSSIASGFDGVQSEEEEEEEEEDGEEAQPPPAKKQRKVGDFSRELSRQRDVYLPARNAAIQKWNEKTLNVGARGDSRDGFGAFANTTLKQIENLLSDKTRLIKRTQTKRSVYCPLDPNSAAADNTDEKKELAEFDEEIFDDDDFYHRLLRELINQRSADIDDPSERGRQWKELQKARNKMKRNVDVKSTKGRRLRYTVHQKLVNFMAPIPYNSYTSEAESELFNSLFGKLKR